MKVLVIGGTGTIGLGIVKESIKRGYETFTISRGIHDERIPEECTILKGDIKQRESIKKILQNQYFDVIFDGLVFRIPNLITSIEMYAGKCKQYIFVSTTGIYERIPEEKYLREDTEQGREEWEYNKGKIACEKYLDLHREKLPFAYTIVRPSVTYGDRRIPFTIVNRGKQWSLVERIRDDKPIVAGPNVEFSICHLDDFSRAVVGLFLNEAAYGKAFHIGGAETICWDDTIYELASIENKQAQIIHIDIELLKIYYPELYMEMKYNKADKLLLDNTNIEKIVDGFRPKVTLKEGIKRTYLVLKNEQEKLPYDEKWNLCMDSLIYVSYKIGNLKEEEMKVAEQYLQKLNISDLEKYIENSKRHYPVYLAKQEIKKIFHKII